MESISDNNFNNSSNEDFSKDDDDEVAVANTNKNNELIKQLDRSENLENSSNNFAKSSDYIGNLNQETSEQHQPHQPTHIDYVENDTASMNEEQQQDEHQQRHEEEEAAARAGEEESPRDAESGEPTAFDVSSRHSFSNTGNTENNPAVLNRNNSGTNSRANKNVRSSSRPVSPISARGTSPQPATARGGGASTNRSHKTNMSTARSLAQSLYVNDLKYFGSQVVVGKPDPTLKSPFEAKFQNMFKKKIRKTNNASSKSMDDAFSEYKRTKDKTTLGNAQTHFFSNDMKYSGDQFKVGKVDSKAVPECEKRFQKKFEATRKALTVDPAKAPPKVLSFNELNEIHTAISMEHTSYRMKK
jgi:hypothetical protein